MKTLITFIMVLVVSACSSNKNTSKLTKKYIYEEKNSLPNVRLFTMDTLVFKKPLTKDMFVVTGDVFTIKITHDGSVDSIKLSENVGRSGLFQIYNSNSHKIVYVPASSSFVEKFIKASKKWNFDSSLEKEFNCFIGITERSEPDKFGSDFHYLVCGQHFDFSYTKSVISKSST